MLFYINTVWYEKNMTYLRALTVKFTIWHQYEVHMNAAESEEPVSYALLPSSGNVWVRD